MVNVSRVLDFKWIPIWIMSTVQINVWILVFFSSIFKAKYWALSTHEKNSYFYCGVLDFVNTAN